MALLLSGRSLSAPTGCHACSQAASDMQVGLPESQTSLWWKVPQIQTSLLVIVVFLLLRGMCAFYRDVRWVLRFFAPAKPEEKSGKDVGCQSRALRYSYPAKPGKDVGCQSQCTYTFKATQPRFKPLPERSHG